MKCVASLAALAAVACGPMQASAAFLRQTPMARVASILEDMKHRIVADGRLEQHSYDKYACWCEDTMGRKAKDIADGKEQIEDLQALLVKLKAEIASHGSEIEQAKKDIAGNVEAQRDATAVRDQERAQYAAERTESEQCTGALEAAIKVLTGSGEKKKFLQTLQEAQLLSVVAGIRDVFAKPSISKSVSSQDLELVRNFVDHPEDFVSGRSGFLSAAQIANNPFGDYAPQSTQIQGILKGMYDTFVGDMEKGNGDEANAQKSFEELMATKKMELDTLQATLEQHQLDEAQKGQKLADSQELLDDTKVQLEADEKMFEDVKTGCQVKAGEWSERTRLRTEELAGVGQAIAILTDPDAVKTFTNATTTFVQLSSITLKSGSTERAVQFARLANLARKYHSLGLFQVAVEAKTGGHFDKVMSSIDMMVENLRKEEQADIEHRDRCQNAEGKNSNDMEDMNYAIGKANKTIERLNLQAGELTSKIAALKDEINGTETEMAQALDMRNEAVAEFRKALQDDADAIAILDQAMAALTRFFKKNKVPLALVRKAEPEAPEYSVDPDKAPETTWSGPKYGGRKSETQGIVAIIGLIKEDLEKEMAEGRADDAAAQKQYEKERGAMQKALNAQLALKVATEKELNNVEGKTVDTEEFKSAKSSDLDAESKLKDSIYSDCAWVGTHFESRRTKRKAEMDGLTEAKSYLSGVEAGDEV